MNAYSLFSILWFFLLKLSLIVRDDSLLDILCEVFFECACLIYFLFVMSVSLATLISASYNALLHQCVSCSCTILVPYLDIKFYLQYD